MFPSDAQGNGPIGRMCEPANDLDLVLERSRAEPPGRHLAAGPHPPTRPPTCCPMGALSAGSRNATGRHLHHHRHQANANKFLSLQFASSSWAFARSGGKQLIESAVRTNALLAFCHFLLRAPARLKGIFGLASSSQHFASPPPSWTSASSC